MRWQRFFEKVSPARDMDNLGTFSILPRGQVLAGVCGVFGFVHFEVSGFSPRAPRCNFKQASSIKRAERYLLP